MRKEYVVLLSWCACLLVGSGVKYIDCAFDDTTFSKSYTIILSLVLGVLVASVMLTDESTFVVFLSTILGVALAGKLDNAPFRLFAVVAIVLPAISQPGLFLVTRTQGILAFVVCVCAASDEVGNDLADRGSFNRVFRWLFLYRTVLKLAIMTLVVWRMASVASALNLLAFDIGYIVVAALSSRRGRRVVLTQSAGTWLFRWCAGFISVRAEADTARE